jgi:hypothetical protein
VQLKLSDINKGHEVSETKASSRISVVKEHNNALCF